MYYVYVLKSTAHLKSYVGITNDISRRLSQHNSGKHPYTKRYLPWTIIHTEEYPNRIEARKREVYLKSASGRRWLSNNVFNE